MLSTAAEKTMKRGSSHDKAGNRAGHITENLYLAATALGLGSCAIGAVEGRTADEAFGLDGENLFIFYAHTVGTVDPDTLKHEDDIYAFVREQGL